MEQQIGSEILFSLIGISIDQLRSVLITLKKIPIAVK